MGKSSCRCVAPDRPKTLKRFGHNAASGDKLASMKLSPLIVGYEFTDRGLVSIFAWIDVGIADSTNGVRLGLIPTTLLFFISSN
jgi:hypothetical protein